MNPLKNLSKSFLMTLLMGMSSAGYAQTYVLVQINQPAALQANAGLGKTITGCVGDSVLIGGAPSATNGTAPYTYSWTPVTGLSNAGIANPMASPANTTLYSLTVTDFKGCTHSDSSTVTVNTCTGISETNSSIYMNIFPNPNDGNFTIVIEGQNGTEQISIEVMSSFGQLVYSEKVISVNLKYEKQVNISNYAKGMYLVKVQGNDNYVIKKLFVN